MCTVIKLHVSSTVIACTYCYPCRSVGHLGSGQFANVEEGTWKKGVNKEVRIALKTMKPGTTEEDKIKFLQEAAIMAQFRHPNVIGLYGVVSKGEPVSMCVCLLYIA